ncbi:MAG: nuclear transport factor 2 family protein [Acidimicrobiia bacterium]
MTDDPVPVGSPTITELVAALYPALAAGDRAELNRLVAPDFVGTLTESLPFGIGGTHHGRSAMIKDGWWAVGRAFSIRIEASEWIECADGRLLVLGRYTGRARSSGAPLDAAFVHLWTARDGRLCAVWHLTDSARWFDALSGSPGGTSGA